MTELRLLMYFSMTKDQSSLVETTPTILDFDAAYAACMEVGTFITASCRDSSSYPEHQAMHMCVANINKHLKISHKLHRPL